MFEDDLRIAHAFVGIFVAKIALDRAKTALQLKIEELDKVLSLLETIANGFDLSVGEEERVRIELDNVLANVTENEKEALIAKLMALGTRGEREH